MSSGHWAMEKAKGEGLLESGDMAIYVHGIGAAEDGHDTNTMRIMRVP